MTDFFFNDRIDHMIYTLSLHDALPISRFALDFLPPYSPELNPIERVWKLTRRLLSAQSLLRHTQRSPRSCGNAVRSEEHTSELQSHSELVCRLLLEKKNN